MHVECPKCGWKNAENAVRCANCFHSLRSAQPAPPPQPPQPQQTQQWPGQQPPAQTPYGPQQTQQVPGQPVPQPPAQTPYGTQQPPGQTQYYPQQQGQQYPQQYPYPYQPGYPQALGYGCAGFWIRVGAVLIDALILAASLFAILVVIIMLAEASSPGILESGEAPSQLVTTFQIAMWVGPLIYFVGMNTAFGATLGKMAVGIKIVKTDGSPIGFGTAIARCVLETVFAVLTCLLAYIAVAVSSKCQGLHDQIAGTYVIHTR